MGLIIIEITPDDLKDYDALFDCYERSLKKLQEGLRAEARMAQAAGTLV